MQFISRLDNKTLTHSDNLNLYRSEYPHNPDAEYREMISVFRSRWQHSMNMYNDYGMRGCSDEDSVVFVMGNKLFDIEQCTIYDTAYDVIYFPNKNMHYDHYFCNWNVFNKVNLQWKSLHDSMHFYHTLPKDDLANSLTNIFHVLLFNLNIRCISLELT